MGNSKGLSAEHCIVPTRSVEVGHATAKHLVSSAPLTNDLSAARLPEMRTENKCEQDHSNHNAFDGGSPRPRRVRLIGRQHDSVNGQATDIAGEFACIRNAGDTGTRDHGNVGSNNDQAGLNTNNTDDHEIDPDDAEADSNDRQADSNDRQANNGDDDSRRRRHS